MLLAERLIIARLRTARFSSLAKANIEIRQLLECRPTRRFGAVEALYSSVPSHARRAGEGTGGSTVSVPHCGAVERHSDFLVIAKRLRKASTVFRRGIPIFVACCATLALASCGTARPNALTEADIPSVLGLQENHIAEVGLLRNAHPGSVCQGALASAAVFTPPGDTLDPISGSFALTHSQVLSDEATCPSARSVSQRFQTSFEEESKVARVEIVKGIGDRAYLYSLNPDARSYAIEWLQRATLGLVVVQGPSNDAHITADLAALLAHRAAASAG